MERQVTGKRRRIPRQTRAKATVDAILLAAAHILRTEGEQALTTARIATLAGVSIGSVYQYFPDKAAILEELRDRHAAWYQDELAQSVEVGSQLPLRAGIRHSVDLLLAMHRVDPALHEGLSSDPNPMSPGQLEAFREQMRRYLADNADALRPVDPDVAAVVVTRAMQAVIHGTALEEPQWLSHPGFAAEVTELVARYLER